MNELGRLVERIGGLLIFAGVAMLAGIFLVVLLFGQWPDFLEPIQSLFGSIGSTVGGFAFVVEVWIFVGPGLLVFWIGRRLQGIQ